MRVFLRRVLGVLGPEFGVVTWQFLEMFGSRKKRGLCEHGWHSRSIKHHGTKRFARFFAPCFGVGFWGSKVAILRGVWEQKEARALVSTAGTPGA